MMHSKRGIIGARGGCSRIHGAYGVLPRFEQVSPDLARLLPCGPRIFRRGPHGVAGRSPVLALWCLRHWAGLNPFNRSAFPSTNTLDNAMAPAAKTGESRMP